MMRSFLRIFFHLLYHPLAFTYDLVAATVSLGRWKDWVKSVLPFIEGNRILEIGHGPGHLQRMLLTSRHSPGPGQNFLVVGIDESAWMGRLARLNLTRHPTSIRQPQPASSDPVQALDYTQINLTRAVSEHLPFPEGYFDTVAATFPTEYIYDPATLTETYRVLSPSGRFVILPGAKILGRGLMDRLMAILFRITGQTPPNLSEIIHERSKEPFGKAGFKVLTHELDIRSSRVFILVATKTTN
jgi:ubiquinone/menaquinone biosynthesis C-methylase UbiE